MQIKENIQRAEKIRNIQSTTYMCVYIYIYTYREEEMRH